MGKLIVSLMCNLVFKDGGVPIGGYEKGNPNSIALRQELRTLGFVEIGNSVMLTVDLACKKA